MKTSTIVILAFCQLIFFSCATTIEETDATSKKFSSTTEREFESIERSDYGSRAPRPNVYKQELARKEQVKMAPPPRVSTPRKLSAKNEERMQEINQNLAFFCMKHRKSSRFKTEEQCQVYTKKVLLICEKKHSVINNTLLNCIKDRLKK